MAEKEPKYRIPSSVGELPDPPSMRRELVVLPELTVTDPKTKEVFATALYEYELNTGEHSEYMISDRVFDEKGQVIRLIPDGRDVRFLARTTRLAGGHRVWATTEAAQATLNRWGHSITNKLLLAANRVNYGETASSEDEAVASAEGNSEET